MCTVPMCPTVGSLNAVVCKQLHDATGMHSEFYCPFCYNTKSTKHKNYRTTTSGRENGKYLQIKRLEDHIMQKHQHELHEMQYACPYNSKCGFRPKTCQEWIDHLKYYHMESFKKTDLFQKNHNEYIFETT